MTDRRTAWEHRERRGIEKQAIGVENVQRMLPLVVKAMTDGPPAPRDLALMGFAPDMMPMMLEAAYCDAWGRTDVIDRRIRSLFTVALMIGVGGVGNEFELGYHAPGAVYNGATVAELEAIVVHAAPYVGYPAAGRAMGAIVDALVEHDLLGEPSPPGAAERRELTGSEKRAQACALLARLHPDSPLLEGAGEPASEVFAAELDAMLLEDVYYDLWTRTDVLTPEDRSVVTFGFLIGLGNLDALREHVPMARRIGISATELEELVYHAAVYVGFPSAASVRTAIAEALR